MVEARWFQRAIITVIVINAITLGLETSPAMVDRWGDVLYVVDHAALYVFVAELLAKIFAYRLRFFTDA